MMTTEQYAPEGRELVESDFPPVTLDRVQIQQVLLIRNGMDAMDANAGAKNGPTGS